MTANVLFGFIICCHTMFGFRVFEYSTLSKTAVELFINVNQLLKDIFLDVW
jgi:hypothetical protein